MITRLVLRLLRLAFVPSRPVIRSSLRNEDGSVFVVARRDPQRVPVLGAPGDTSAVTPRAASSIRTLVAVWWPAMLVGSLSGSVVFARALTSWTADGDPALHLRLIKDIAATGHLPTALPNFPARVGEGGVIEQSFPYAYAPLYHIVGAGFYALAGVSGVLALNAVAAAVIALVVYRFTCRRAPAAIAVLAAAGFFVAPNVQGPFTNVYMEPLMLGLIAAGAWLAYVATATRSWRPAIAAGLLLGLAISTRQSALIHVGVLAGAVCAHVASRGAWQPSGWRRELPWVAGLAGGIALTAAPGLLYLMGVNGGIGYADVTIPGTGNPIAVDAQANAYMAGITKPGGSLGAWLHRYANILFFSGAWLPRWSAIIAIVLASAGLGHLYGRGGASRFFARWVLLQVAAEITVFMLLHGNARYVLFSQALFHSTLPVGAYAIVRAIARRGRFVASLATATVILAAGWYLAPVGHWNDYLRTRDGELRSFRATSYAEMGEWVNANTRPDALILVPRAYTAELTWERNVTWVTFYGNAWVVDAIGAPDPKAAHAILAEHGVDYVAIQNPPGSYVDRMPADGMRSYLQIGAPRTPYFTLVHQTKHSARWSDGREMSVGMRLYRVNDVPGARR